MTKFALILIAGLMITTGATIVAADSSDSRDSAGAVGGGVRDPWRSPYKTA